MTTPVVRGSTFAASATGTEPTGTVQGDLLYGVAKAGAVPTDWKQIGTGSGDSAWVVCAIIRGAVEPSYVFGSATNVMVYAIEAGTYDTSKALSSTVAFLSTSASPWQSPAIAAAAMADLAIVTGSSSHKSSPTPTPPTGFTAGANGHFNPASGYAAVSSVGTGPYDWTGTIGTLDAFTIDVPGISAVTVTKAATFDAELAARQQVTAAMDAIFAVQNASAMTFGAELAKAQTLSVTLDAMLKAFLTKTVMLDAELAAPHTKAAAFDAYMANLHTLALALDADLAGVETKALGWDVDLQGLLTKVLTLDAELAIGMAKPLAFGAELSALRSVTMELSAELAALRTQAVTWDASTAFGHTQSVAFSADMAGVMRLGLAWDAVIGRPEELLPAGTAILTHLPAATAIVSHIPAGTASLRDKPLPGYAVLR